MKISLNFLADYSRGPTECLAGGGPPARGPFMRVCLLNPLWFCGLCLGHLKASAALAFVGAPSTFWKGPHPLLPHQGAPIREAAIMGPRCRDINAVSSNRDSRSNSSSNSKDSSTSNKDSSNNSSKSISSGKSWRSGFLIMSKLAAFASSSEKALGDCSLRGLSSRRKAIFTRDQGGPSKTRRLLKRGAPEAPSLETHELQEPSSKPEKAGISEERKLHAKTSVTAAAAVSKQSLSLEDRGGPWMDLGAPPEELRPSACLLAGGPSGTGWGGRELLRMRPCFAGAAGGTVQQQHCVCCFGVRADVSLQFSSPQCLGGPRGPPHLSDQGGPSHDTLQGPHPLARGPTWAFFFRADSGAEWGGPSLVVCLICFSFFRCVFDGEAPCNGGPPASGNEAQGAPAQRQEAALRRFFQLDVRFAPMVKKWGLGESPGCRVLMLDPVEALFSFICSANNNIPRLMGPCLLKDEQRQRALRGGPLWALVLVSHGTPFPLSPPSLGPPKRPLRSSVGLKGVIFQIDVGALGGPPLSLVAPKASGAPPTSLISFNAARLVRGAAERLMELGGPSFLEALRWQKLEAEGPPFAHLKAATAALLQLP
ncbi:hypothetical protein Emag_003056 [Eimeria magna]